MGKNMGWDGENLKIVERSSENLEIRFSDDLFADEST